MRLLLIALFAISAWGDSHYVDCNRPDDSGNGLSPSTAKRNLSATNTDVTVTSGDVIRLKRGCTWSTGAGPRASNLTYTVYDVADTGDFPIVSDATTSFILGSGDTGIVIDHITMTKTVSVSSAASLTIRNSIIRDAPGNGLTVNGSTVTLENVLISRNAGYGITMSDTGGNPIVTIKNCAIVGNGYGTALTNGGFGIQMSTNGTLNYSYSLLAGNGRGTTTAFTTQNINGAGTQNDLGWNSIDVVPGYRSTFVPVSDVKIVLSVDGDDYANIGTYSTALADDFDAQFGASTIPFVVYVTGMDLMGESVKSALALLPARGIEIGSHSYTHSDITKTTAFTVTTTNTGTNTFDVNRSTSTVSLTSTGNPENNVSLVWDSSSTICSLKLQLNGSFNCTSGGAATGKGWTITNTTNISNYAKLKGLDTQSSTSFGYAANWLMSAFYASEVDDSATWINSNLGVTPTSFAYGGGWAGTASETYVAGAGVFTSARTAGGGGMYMPSLRLFQLGGQAMATALTGLSAEADIRKAARHAVILAQASGGYMGLFWHLTDTSVTNQKLVWFVDEVRKVGASIAKQDTIATAVRADHSTSDGGVTWTKTYTDASDYRLKGQAQIRTGTDAGSGYTCWSPKAVGEVLDPDVYGWSIGPYCWVRSGVGAP